jgi:hypothetical protein
MKITVKIIFNGKEGVKKNVKDNLFVVCCWWFMVIKVLLFFFKLLISDVRRVEIVGKGH